jgi:hypothetical protein
MNAVMFMGAGFSRSAGLPLTSELFESDIYIPSTRSEKRFERVFRIWEKWHEDNRFLAFSCG